jgi:predicted ATPase/DNA-binding SARP family transcriptional activator
VHETSIEVRLLGPVQALVNGETARLGGRRQLALLALLALEPCRAVPAGTLAEELWQGAPPAGAEPTLRTYVSRLRQALGSDAVVGRAGGYALSLEPERLDVHRFERLVREGREALGRGAAGLAAERLCAALELWRGRALADVSEGGALASEALRLDELRSVALEERIEADLALGRHSELVPELRALVQEQPLRERLWRQLVLALYRSGQQADALAAYGDARALLDRELGLEPGPELKELERAILRQEVEPVAPAELRHNLPAALASFVGRDRELAEVEQLLRERRLVTLTGLGGTGKTRLALEAARRQVDAWTDGVWLVDLTELGEESLVPGAVAAALGVPEEAPEQLMRHARPLELLLVLDNCEHVVDACAELVHSLLRACPNVRVLATSRVPLGVRGELDYALDPLAEDAAVRLFLDRAAAVRRDVDADERSRDTIGSICRELDCLPLAVELAAARAKALSLDDIAGRLDDRFRFLRAWQRVADPRHQTLQTTMDWSYGLLSPEEQQLLRRLSVFAGGAALDAVTSVCFDGDEDAAVDLTGRLVAASLVRADPGRDMRYRLLETVRQYAAALFADDPDAGEVRRRHAVHYLRVAESANLALDALGHGAQDHAPVLREQHNLRGAIDWATAEDGELGLRLMLALENFWITGALAEGRRRWEALLPSTDGVDAILRARALRDYAACFDVLRDFTAARPLYEQSRELFRQAGDELAVAYLDYRLGIVLRHTGHELGEVEALWQASLETFRRLGDPIGEIQAFGDLGALALLQGDIERARPMIDASIAMAREAGWLWWETQKLLLLAEAAVERGEIDEAEERARLALPNAVRMANRPYMLFGLAILARVAALRGDADRALELWATVEATEDPPGRFGKFDREAYAGAMPDLPRPEPLALDDAVTLALAD